MDPSKRRADKNAPAMVYPDLLSSITPLLHCRALGTYSSKEKAAEENSNSEWDEVIGPESKLKISTS